MWNNKYASFKDNVFGFGFADTDLINKSNNWCFIKFNNWLPMFVVNMYMLFL